MKQDIVKLLHPHILKIVEENDLKLYDLEFVKEDGIWFLRVSIEKQDGTMDFETAEIISNLVSKMLDDMDPIDHEYILDVCSPGAERPLNDFQDYQNNIGNYITVYLKQKDSNNKDSYTGDLNAVNNQEIEMTYKDKTKSKKVTIQLADIEKAHTAIKF